MIKIKHKSVQGSRGEYFEVRPPDRLQKPTTDIGLEFAQEDLLGLHQTDTLALTFETVREDSLETSHLSTAVLGNMEHPFLAYTKDRLPSNPDWCP